MSNVYPYPFKPETYYVFYQTLDGEISEYHEKACQEMLKEKLKGKEFILACQIEHQKEYCINTTSPFFKHYTIIYIYERIKS